MTDSLGGTATVTDAKLAPPTNVLLITARCNSCTARVTHGAGSDLDSPVLGARVAHCACDHYEIIDPDGIVPTRVAKIRDALSEKARRRAEARARRAAG